MVVVRNGVAGQISHARFVGLTLRELRDDESVADILNFTGNEQFTVNGDQQDVNYVLRDGDSVEAYSTTVGQKG